MFMTTGDGSGDSTERMRFRNACYVGVGTDTPNSIFEVAPHIRAVVGVNNATASQIIDFRANRV